MIGALAPVKFISTGQSMVARRNAFEEKKSQCCLIKDPSLPLPLETEERAAVHAYDQLKWHLGRKHFHAMQRDLVHL